MKFLTLKYGDIFEKVDVAVHFTRLLYGYKWQGWHGDTFGKLLGRTNY